MLGAEETKTNNVNLKTVSVSFKLGNVFPVSPEPLTNGTDPAKNLIWADHEEQQIVSWRL